METVPLTKAFLYGPATSPRLGETLWVNPLPIKYKLCSFNCLYCRLGESDKITSDISPYLEDMPGVDDIVATLKLRLDENIEFDTVALSGNGEPTLHPDFLALARKINQLLKSCFPGKTLALLSNSSGLIHEDVIESIDLFDLPVFKLDVGRPSSFYRINRPDPNVVYEEILEKLREIGPRIHLQSVFVGGLRGNMNEVDIPMWAQAVADIKPKAVEIYSTKRSAPENDIDIVPHEKLEELAKEIEKQTGVPIVSFGKWE